MHFLRILENQFFVLFPVELNKVVNQRTKVTIKQLQQFEREKKLTNGYCKGATGIEPVTSRSAVECSTTELCPLITVLS